MTTQSDLKGQRVQMLPLANRMGVITDGRPMLAPVASATPRMSGAAEPARVPHFHVSFADPAEPYTGKRGVWLSLGEMRFI